ncbi:hypothetical protein B0H14DRAFT_3510253 [Mycena olivaceomarginata]|nr:hypothetical protein B0H14DRAFT_3510253 [Mycena olivaceomarginata]
MVIDPLAQELGHPTFPDIRFYERNLPQHVIAKFVIKRNRSSEVFVFFRKQRGDAGQWNNILQEQLLNTHLAYLSDRAYVFPGYVARDHPPLPDTLPNGDRHWLHIPANAFTSGSTTGGPLSSDGTDRLMRRAVSEEWYNIVCPRTEVVTLDLHGTTRELGLDDNSEGVDIMAQWAKKLSEMTAPCVSVDGGPLFSYVIFSSKPLISLWPSYSQSPALKYFAWSPLITAAVFRNFQLLSQHPPPQALIPTGDRPHTFQSFPPYNSSAPPIPGLLGIHLRRGDFKQHCYRLPALPDYLDIRQGRSRGDAAFDHCWPSAETIVSRVNAIRQSAESGAAFPSQNLRRIYIATNGDPSWIGNLTAHLRADGWDVSSSFDMQLTLEEHTPWT